jgi:flagellar biosynthesis protein FliQ
MDKFIIMNVHDATPKKTPKIIPKFLSIFFLGAWKKKTMFKWLQF